jgi:hypothetical protein
VTLSFPNRSRSYDAKGNRVRFWGYDSALEISFFLEVSALQRLCPVAMDAEAKILEAFDALRERIHEVAVRRYSRRGNGAYVLAAADF